MMTTLQTRQLITFTPMQTAVKLRAFLRTREPSLCVFTQAEMKARLQKDDATNILYVGFVLWHCGQKANINITQNYNYAHADDVFQMYNPGSKGHGKKVGNYVNAFYNYYEAVGK